MRQRLDPGILGQLAVLFEDGTEAGRTDAEWLAEYRQARGRGESADRAFSALVRRHGPMVLRTCQGILRDPHDAHDAFQATFLILLRRAQGLWVADSLGPWLHRVACRVARRARQQAFRRGQVESRAGAGRALWTNPPLPDDVGTFLHAEIDRLPEAARTPLILCDLMGHSHDEAAARMGCPVGTVKSRLSRAREKLRTQLERRGFAPSVLAAGVWPPPAYSVPEALIASTIRSSLETGGSLGQGGIGMVPARVIALMQGELGHMYGNILKWTAAALVGVGIVGAGMASQPARAQREMTTAEKHAPARDEAKAPPENPAKTENTAKTAPNPPRSEQESVAAFKHELDLKKLENEAAAEALKSEGELKKHAIEAAAEEMKIELEAKKIAMEAEAGEFDIMVDGIEKVAGVAGKLQGQAKMADRLVKIRLIELDALSEVLVDSQFGFASFARKDKLSTDDQVQSFEAAEAARKRIDEIISELAEAESQVHIANAMIASLSDKYPQMFPKPAKGRDESSASTSATSPLERRLDAVEAKLDRLIEALDKTQKASMALEDHEEATDR